MSSSESSKQEKRVKKTRHKTKRSAEESQSSGGVYHSHGQEEGQVKKVKEKQYKNATDSSTHYKLNDHKSNKIIKNIAFMRTYFAPPGVNYDDVERKSSYNQSPNRYNPHKHDPLTTKHFGRFRRGCLGGTEDNIDLAEDLRKILKHPKVGENGEDKQQGKTRFSRMGGDGGPENGGSCSSGGSSGEVKVEKTFGTFLREIKEGCEVKEGECGSRKPISEMDVMLRDMILETQKKTE